MAADHTPGPWKATLSGDHKYWHITGTADSYFEDLDCEVDSDDKDGEVAEANARLICAAPALLAACEATLLYHSAAWQPQAWEKIVGVGVPGSAAALCDFIRVAVEAARKGD